MHTVTPLEPDFHKCRGRYSKAGMLRALQEQNASRVGLDEHKDPEGAEPAGQEGAEDERG